MFKPWCLLHLFFLYFALKSAAGQHESVDFSSLVQLQRFPNTGISLAVSLPIEDLNNVSTSVLQAENWLRTNILAHYPATNITTILVGHNLLCKKEQENKVSLILPSIKNIYHSLTRWGLHNEIKVSTTFSSNCLDQDSKTYNVGISEKYIKPILDFFRQVNAPYILSITSDLSTLSDETITTLLTSHLVAMKSLVHYSLNKIYMTIENQEHGRPSSRKLSFFNSKYTFPTKPTTPLAQPAFAANSPLPPLIGNISPPLMSLPFAPEMGPTFNPISPFNGPHLPPCIPSHHHGGSGHEATPPAPAGMVHNGLWCVAKPSVPPETLQEALDYACGEGGADCEAISPTGSCYYPDTVVAHASYAFNSYWQKTKTNGGSCGFGGTAMLINSDPSYSHCRFIIA